MNEDQEIQQFSEFFDRSAAGRAAMNALMLLTFYAWGRWSR
jgi:hypothetical protein